MKGNVGEGEGHVKGERGVGEGEGHVRVKGNVGEGEGHVKGERGAVSYTHLTLPTRRTV